MTAEQEVWLATRELANAWQSSRVVEAYVGPVRLARRQRMATAPQSLVEAVYAKAGALAQQPLLLAHLGQMLDEDFNLLAQTADGRDWARNGALVAESFIRTMAWLRSSLPGYPLLRVPQLVRDSALTTAELTLRVPWRFDDLRAGLQTLAEPPGVSQALRVGPEVDNKARALAAALRGTAAWSALKNARSMLTVEDHEQLKIARNGSASRLKELDSWEPLRATRRLQYRERELENCLGRLSGRALEYTTAFAEANRLVDDVGAVLSQLVAYADFQTLVVAGDLEVSNPRGRPGREVRFVTAGEDAVLHTRVATVARVSDELVADLVYVSGVAFSWNGDTEKVVISGWTLPGSAAIE